MAEQTTAIKKSKKKKVLDSFFPNGDQPTWEVAYLFPPQGKWTVSDYLELESAHDTFPLVELSNGRLEVLPLPTEIHQFIVKFFFLLLDAFAEGNAPGTVLFSPLKVRIGKTGYRYPDVLYMKAGNTYRRHNKAWNGADLVMEVVSPGSDSRKRDLKHKPVDYARARIPEYWIIDPKERLVRVLVLAGKSYKVHGDFASGEQATSVLLKGFAVSVDELLAPAGSLQA